jgi:hypothetical protein
MKEYRCDHCKKPIEQGSVIYELRAIYSPVNHSESHYHWDCLFKYLLSERKGNPWLPSSSAN